MNDGVLHTVLVKNISKLRFARLFPDYSAGNHEKLPKDVVRFSTAKVIAHQLAALATVLYNGRGAANLLGPI